MIILHCLKETTWEKVKGEFYYGRDSIDEYGFIHCSSVRNFWRVDPNLINIDEPLLLLYIETDKVEPEIKWEDDGNYGRKYQIFLGN